MNTREIRTMAHHNTALRQLTAISPQHDFEHLATIHHNRQKFRSYNLQRAGSWYTPRTCPNSAVDAGKRFFRRCAHQGGIAEHE